MPRNVLRPCILTVASFALSIHAQQPSVQTTKADRILVVKSTHTMTLYADGKVLKIYHVWLGRGPGNAKQQQGDNETPEGIYTINGRKTPTAPPTSLCTSPIPTPQTANAPASSASIQAETS